MVRAASLLEDDRCFPWRQNAAVHILGVAPATYGLPLCTLSRPAWLIMSEKVVVRGSLLDTVVGSAKTLMLSLLGSSRDMLSGRRECLATEALMARIGARRAPTWPCLALRSSCDVADMGDRAGECPEGLGESKGLGMEMRGGFAPERGGLCGGGGV